MSSISIRGAVLRTASALPPYSESKPLVVRDDLVLDGPKHEELLIRIEAASVCHSDLSVINGDRPRPVPMLLGHEAAGIIEQMGSGCEDFRIGQRVVMTFLPRCGDCKGCRSAGVIPCVKGSKANEAGELLGGGSRIRSTSGDSIRHHLGVSAFATHAVVSKRSVVPVNDDVPAEVAALLGCAMLTGGGAILNVGKPSPDDEVAVLGMGGVGAGSVLLALALGVKKVVAVDLNADKLEFAKRLGAHAVFTPEQLEKEGHRFSLIIEAVGSSVALESAYNLLTTGGQLVTVGLPRPGSSITIDPLSLTVGNRSITGSYLGTSNPEKDIPVYEDLWREGRLNVSTLITSRVPLSQINEAMDNLAETKEVRQIITFDEE